MAASHVGRRRAQAARERRVALGALGVAVLIAWAGIAFHGAVTSTSVASAAVATTQHASVAQAKARSSAKKHHATYTVSRKRVSHPAPVKVAVAKTASHVASTAKTNKPRPIAVAAATTKLVASKRVAKNRVVTIETFGYSFAPAPGGCRFVADVRNIQAGAFAQNENGLMAAVRKRVMAVKAARVWLAVMRTNWEPKLKSGDEVAIGCARGHHRSVTLAYYLAQDLRAHGWKVIVIHRDISKTW